MLQKKSNPNCYTYSGKGYRRFKRYKCCMKTINKIISFPYQCAHALHKSIYRLGILKSHKLPCYTISVGNISFGGTGKTPFTIALATKLAQAGIKTCVLTRGYKSSHKKSPLIINSLQIPSSLTVTETGDEAMEMLKSFNKAGLEIIVAINPNRYEAGREAIQRHGVRVCILDDGLQHLQLRHDMNIILKNINESGFYREFESHCLDADFLIHTKVDEKWLSENPEKFSLKYNLSLTKKLHSENRLGVFTGIGDPQSLVKMLRAYLKSQNIDLDKTQIDTWFFPDHHFFSKEEVTQVLTLGINIITTAKDLERIPDEYRSSFAVLDLELEPHPGDLFERILAVVKTDVSGLVVGLTSPTKGDV